MFGNSPATGEPFAGRDGPRAESALLNVREVADLLGCSERHIYRLRDSGRMPGPVKLGALVRWRRRDVHEWVDGGCRAVRSVKGGRDHV